MKLKLISCEVFRREFEYLTRRCPNEVQVDYQAFGLHSTPDLLKNEIQKNLDETPPDSYDAILLGYGLCSHALEGVRATHTKVVLPRSHDCIAILLGSRERYTAEFQKNSGTYWYSIGWIENKSSSGDGFMTQAGTDAMMAAAQENRFQDYVKRFGEDNARFLMEEEGKWKQHYSRVAYIHREFDDGEKYREYCEAMAAREGWTFEEMTGSDEFLNSLLSGDWTEENFLVLLPGETCVPSMDDRVVTAVPTDSIIQRG